jgi:Common central domain of tyrosinase/von Willebrand factor type A domain
MTLGDGIRRDVATVPQAERDLLLDAFLQLDTTKLYPDGVTYWDKQEDIHKNAHFAGVDVHSGPAFIPWHRVLVNRLEALLREVHPEISLHYWDWTTDPRVGGGGRAALMTNTFMGGPGDPVGAPFANFESTEKTDPLGDGIHDHIWRQVGASPGDTKADGRPNLADDGTILAPANAEFTAFNTALQSAHNSAHGFIGGGIGNAHFSFHDPFVFLLHSNMDRLWARWQTEPGHADRISPATAYGLAVIDPTEHVEPWAGGTGLEPWASDVTRRAVITYRDPSVIAPTCYDTNYQNVVLDEVETPGAIIHFNDVPTGETGARAAVFRIFTCGDANLEVKAGTGPNPPYTVLTPNGRITVPHAPTSYAEGRIWFGFTGAAAGVPVPDGSVTIHCVETGEDFNFTLRANSIARPNVAAMLCLDQSGSMAELAGIDATTKRIDVLHLAATNFVQLLERYPGDGVGMVSFDDQSHPGTGVTRYNGGAFDLAAVQAAIAALNPAGSTSIGNGLTLARSTLSPATGYDQKALVVLTDGLENSPSFIADVASTIDDRTFAIGLGTAEQVSTAALRSLAANTNGYLVLTGRLSPSIDDTFRLTKYFLQILAGVTNNQIVTDPSGYLLPGDKVRIPFQLNETDIDTTPILLADRPYIRFSIETPAGDLMDPGSAAVFGATYATGTDMAYYRFTLPLPVGGQPAHAGTWYAILEIDDKYGDRISLRSAGANASAGSGNGVRYSFSAQAWSNLRMVVRVEQSSLEPGAGLALRAVLSEFGIPLAGRAEVSALVERPDLTTFSVNMVEAQPGVFEGAGPTGDEGVYRVRVVARGHTMRGLPFTREQLLSAVTVRGGDQPPRTSESIGTWRRELCELLECLWAERSLQQFMAERNLDQAAVRKCLAAWCARPAPESAAALAERSAPSSQGASATIEISREDALLRILGDALRTRDTMAVDSAKPVVRRTIRRLPRRGSTS